MVTASRPPAVHATASATPVRETAASSKGLDRGAPLGTPNAANEFPVERPGVIGVDRESGALLRLAPIPWKGADTDPPIQRWSWIHAPVSRDERDPRPETMTLDGPLAATAYVEAKDGWRLRWPFVRPHLRGSVAMLLELARGRAASAGFAPLAVHAAPEQAARRRSLPSTAKRGGRARPQASGGAAPRARGVSGDGSARAG